MSSNPVGGGLRRHVREIVNHGGIFAVGLLVTRLTSVLLLPFYTRVLTPADYGALAILDIVGELLRLTIGTGLMNAAGRFHFDTDSEDERSTIWWSALVALMGASTFVVSLLMLSRGYMAALTFGPQVASGPELYALMLGALWCGLPELLFQVHLRVVKKSALSVWLALARLVVNAGLNLLLLYHFHFGVAGILWGNLLTSALWAALHCAFFINIRGPVRTNRSLLPSMAKFGGPMMGVALLSLAMHQIDRYILVGFVSLSDIGIYSIAYQIGQGVNSLVLSPFSQIWSVVVFEVARMDTSKKLFVDIFGAFIRGLLLVLLAASFGARLAVHLLAPKEYAAAADLIPVIAFAYFFFSLDDHFRVPALLQKRTGALLTVYGLAALLNVVLNLLMVPRWGITGAAWASVGTFAGFSLAGLMFYRRIDKINYEVIDSLMVIALTVAAYVTYRFVLADYGLALSLAGSAVIWLLLLAFFIQKPLRAWRSAGEQLLPTQA